MGRHPKFRYRPYLGNSTAYVVDTMQTVLHYFFSTDSFEACLIGVVNQGGDTDTTGAVLIESVGNLNLDSWDKIPSM